MPQRHIFQANHRCIISPVGAHSSSAGLFRQSVPDIALSIERRSSRVPDDGYFYVVLRNEIKGRFRTKAQATVLYRALLQDSGYKPAPIGAAAPSSSEAVERYLDEKEAYWSDSHRHTKRGGKGRY